MFWDVRVEQQRRHHNRAQCTRAWMENQRKQYKGTKGEL